MDGNTTTSSSLSGGSGSSSDTNNASTIDHQLLRYHHNYHGGGVVSVDRQSKRVLSNIINRQLPPTPTPPAHPDVDAEDDEVVDNHLLVDLDNVDDIINYVIKMQYICSE